MVEVKDVGLLSKREEMYFDLMFNKNLDVNSALKYLRESNVAATRTELLKFKQNMLGSLIDQQREEHMAEILLTSFDRTKIEFEDLIKETKNILEQAKETSPALALDAIRELRSQIETALSQQNKATEQLIHAMREKRSEEKEKEQVFEILKREKERWLIEYGASITPEQKIVFETPTPEFVDFVTRWKFHKEMKDGQVTING